MNGTVIAIALGVAGFLVTCLGVVVLGKTSARYERAWKEIAEIFQDGKYRTLPEVSYVPAVLLLTIGIFTCIAAIVMLASSFGSR